MAARTHPAHEPAEAAASPRPRSHNIHADSLDTLAGPVQSGTARCPCKVAAVRNARIPKAAGQAGAAGSVRLVRSTGRGRGLARATLCRGRVRCLGGGGGER